MSADISLTQPDYQSNCRNEADNLWGTYTYDVLVLAYTGPNPVWPLSEAADRSYLKRDKDGYHLRVPE